MNNYEMVNIYYSEHNNKKNELNIQIETMFDEYNKSRI